MSQLPNETQIERLRQQGKIQEVMRLRNILRRDKQAICNDPPSDALRYEVKLELGDVIITASDGVYDNLFNREILEIIENYKRQRYEEKRLYRSGLRGPPCFLSEPEEALELATRICQAARAKVDNGEAGKRVETPYQRKFKKTYNTTWEVSQSADLGITRALNLINSIFLTDKLFSDFDFCFDRVEKKTTSLRWSRLQ